MAEDGALSQADIDALTAGLLGDASADSGINASALQPEVETILEQGSSVLSTLLNRATSMSLREIKDAEASALAEGFGDDGLTLRLAFEKGLPGEMCLVLGKDTAALLCGLMMGGDGATPYKEEDADALNEFGNQLMGAVCTAMGSRHSISVSSAQAQTHPLDPAFPPFGLDGSALAEAELSIEGAPRADIRLLLSSALVARLSGASGKGSDSGRDSFGGGAMAQSGGYDGSLIRNLEDSPPNIQMLLDINLNVTIELGRTRLSIRKVLELGPGSIIELDRLAGEPVDLLVNDKVVAKGEVVVVDEYFGIRVISLVSPEERIKQLK
jgi:flagellar motor switch protein FliN/FliY